MTAELLAFAAAALAVLAAWEAVAVAGAVSARVTAIVAPLRAGREPDPSERRRLVVTGTLAVFAAGWMLAGPVLAAMLATVAPLATHRALAVVRARRRQGLVDGAPAMARAIADALAGGSSILAAVTGAHRGGVTGPVRQELALVAQRLAVGEPTELALERLRVAADHPAYDAVVAAILLQREAGGDLAGLLRRLAATLEEDARAEADARSLTAQARFSAGIVASLPVGAAVLAELAAPGSIGALIAAPLSAALVACSIALQMVAWILIRRAARIRA